jgi:CheY-like chemotaxis protein
MPSEHWACGRKHLARRSALAGQNPRVDRERRILVVDNEHFGADSLIATLRVVLGYEASIDLAATLDDAIALVGSLQPAVIFLDDAPDPAIDPLHTIPRLRAAGYGGPIIVVGGGDVTRVRRLGLIAAGAGDVIERDEVDSVRLTEALLALARSDALPAGPHPQD